MFLIRARVASPGYGIGHIRRFRGTAPSLADSVSQLRPDLTLSDLRHAVDRTASQIEELQQRVADRLPEAVAMIFSAHLLMLKDPGFVETMARQIESGKPVGQAVLDVAQYYVDIFGGSSHPHMREKVQDVEDLVLRLIDNLRQDMPQTGGVGSHAVIVAGSLYPSELVTLSLEEPSGFVLVGGGATSHVSILARSLEVPLLMADDARLMEISEGTPVLLDGHTGNIYVDPSAEVIREFETRRDVIVSRHGSRRAEGTTRTQDGTHVQLMANINLLREVTVAREVNAAGIGLYRTEFPFLIRPGFPDEEEQYLIYRQLFEAMAGKPVTVRTLDVGGDKTLGYYPHGDEDNPELGLRSIRFSLRHRDVFAQQIRAILRAGADAHDLRLMFPMISSVDEFREARAVVTDCVMQLQHESTHCHTQPQIGMMVELPSVLETAEEYCREADFFSIGSNDFIQYMLAADRGNESVAAYYCAHHPAVLRGIARFVRTAQACQRSVSVCGEVAHQKEYIPFLLGVGVRILSVDPQCIVDLQQFIQSLSIPAAEHEAETLLARARSRLSSNGYGSLGESAIPIRPSKWLFVITR